MKKYIGLGVFALILFTSCKKDWTCTCTSNGNFASYIIEDQTKSDAKAECDSGDGSAAGITVDCELQ